ncbi:hypothetical protein [Marinoscillum sp. MHG1-6]|uniref:hypothetical protein n=1 Tax=Marinoscillum sp. MHG1-6 TaxID=2959627 RepID=UPI00215780B7|nr:hypothetical protein [Marinoscillum sp. MHG1-6]
MTSFLRALTWGFTIVAIILFWLSIRSENDQVMYTLAALVAWLLGQGAHLWYKKNKPKDESQ